METIKPKDLFKILLSGKKIRVMNTDKRIQYVMSLKDNNEMGIKEIVEVADTNVHNGFMSIVDGVSKLDPKYDVIRKAETDNTVDFVLFRSSLQTILKDTKHGETLFSL
jgi:CO dehydrogenase/acetyl-CoA synthase beta subunit